jgi:hypothetical protein
MLHAILVTAVGGSICYALFGTKAGQRNMEHAQRSAGFAMFWLLLVLATLMLGSLLVAELSAALGAA